MRRLLPLLVLAGLGLAVLVWWGARGGEGGAALPAVGPAERTEEPAPPPVEAAPPEPARAVDAEPSTQHAPELDEPPVAAPAAPTCALLGRVVDAEGRPLADVSVRASAYRTWREDVEVPRLDGPYDLRGFEVLTDATGAFHIDAPVPTAQVVVVRVLPDRFHDSWDTRLGNASSCDGPPLGEGPRDLGEIRLARAGAIHGRVTDASGAPLEGVEMGTGPEPNLTYSRDGHTGPDGTYLIPHAVVGTYGVKAKHDGYLLQFRSPVTIEAGRETVGVDFVLETAPSIEGLVVDDAGRPVEGAKLWGWPASSGRGAGARSGADGRFVVYLPQDEPYRFSVECDGYATWDAQSGEDTTFEPGERDARIELRPIPRTRFLVVDAKTGEPIERFGLNILENNGSASKRHVFTEKRPPRQADHPGGVVEATARVGVDQYIVAADGYSLQYADVEHAGPDDPGQTIRMRRSGVVLGRVVRDGAPVAGAAVTLFGVRRSSRRDPDGETHETVRVERNEQSSATTGADGRFTLGAPSRGELRLVVAPRAGAPLVVDRVKVRSGKELDLGDLELLPGATVDGRVLLPPGVEPAGLVVYLGHWQDGVKTVTDARGRFRFEELAAGSNTVMLDDRPGELAAGAQAAFELRAGEVTEVTIDAREHGVCEVSLRIDLGGLNPSGAQVDLVRVGEERERERLGECDDEGSVHGFVRAWGAAEVVLRMEGSRTLEHPDARLELVAGRKLDEVVRFELGTVRVLLPTGVALPEEGTLRLVLEPDGGGQEAHAVSVSIAHGAPQVAGGLATAIAGGVEVRAVPAGRWNARVELEEADAELVRVPVGSSSFRLERTPYFSGAARVELRAGETIELRL